MTDRRSEADIPEMVKPELNDPTDPTEVGGAQAEANGIWRILRNSAFLAVIALGVVALASEFG